MGHFRSAQIRTRAVWCGQRRNVAPLLLCHLLLLNAPPFWKFDTRLAAQFQVLAHKSETCTGGCSEEENAVCKEPSGRDLEDDHESTIDNNKAEKEKASGSFAEDKANVPCNLYTEIMSMMYASNFINTLARFRRDSRVERSEMTTPDFLMSLPKKFPEVSDWMKNNYKCLNEANTQEKFDLSGLENMRVLEEVMHSDGAAESTLEVMDDRFAFAGFNADVVYGIARNPGKKRLTVVFRGTFQEKDWIQDMKALSKDVGYDAEMFEAVNGSFDIVEGLKNPTVHTGFYEYLFMGKEKRDGVSKIEEILDQVFTLLRQPRNEGFSLYVTGHSLGAALATLFATVCAISDETPKPVKLFTFASPHVGKSSFESLHERLEQLGRLQHLRTTNNDDLTPQGLGGLGYRHVGVHLNLIRNVKRGREPCSISSSKVQGFWDVWSNKMKVTPRWLLGKYGLEMHQLYEHDGRLVKCRSSLEALTLDELYLESDLKG